ncbi:hypothetical protein BC829DRAFT_256441 [Chytridium lagenaria]|nr:hypothetical protein BC829DRAFT_256441 [Chytridium lagenaria]
MLTDAAIRGSAWLYVALITVTNIPQFSLFSLHPISMALMFACLVEASLSFHRRKKAAKAHHHHHHDGQPCTHDHDHEGEVNAKPIVTKTEQTDQHASLAYAAVALIALGMLVIYYVKETKEKPHFSTWHSWMGIGFVVMAVFQAIGGTQARQMKNFQFLRMHRSNGVGLFFFLALVPIFILKPSLVLKAGWQTRNCFLFGCDLRGTSHCWNFWSYYEDR